MILSLLGSFCVSKLCNQCVFFFYNQKRKRMVLIDVFYPSFFLCLVPNRLSPKRQSCQVDDPHISWTPCFQPHPSPKLRAPCSPSWSSHTEHWLWDCEGGECRPGGSSGATRTKFGKGRLSGSGSLQALDSLKACLRPPRRRPPIYKAISWILLE